MLELGSPEAVETVFYQAFRAADIQLMMTLWGPAPDILCVHPGAAALLGRQAIQRGWSYIFGGGPVQIAATLLHRQQHEHLAWHGIEERLTNPANGRITSVFASHLYVKTDAGWRLHLHHASASPPTIPDTPKLH